MKPNYLLLLGLLWLSLSAGAQQWELQHSFGIEKPAAVTADLYGQLYLASTEGEIKSYSPQGRLLYSYSPQSAASFSSLEARPGMQLLAFDESNQSLLMLDRFLNPISSKQLPAELFNYVTALSGSAGSHLWLADAGDLQLKQWRTDTRQLSTSIQLNLLKQQLRDIMALREHQHKLYLFSPSLLLVFDQMGTFEKAFPLPAWKSFAFANENLLLLTADKLLVMPLYGGEALSFPLPEAKNYEHVLFTNDRYYFFQEKEASVYRLVP